LRVLPIPKTTVLTEFGLTGPPAANPREAQAHSAAPVVQKRQGDGKIAKSQRKKTGRQRSSGTLSCVF